MADYNLLPDDQPQVPDSWFSAQTSKHSQNTKNAALRSFHDQEVKALKAYHDGEISTEAAANLITRPITESPIPELGDYSDDAAALGQLWDLMTTALVEWPSSRTQDLVSLLVAITKVPGHIHRGEALDDEGKPRSWRRLPWIEMVWYDAHWMQPGMITRRASDDADRTRRRDIYVKIQNVESQLVAAGLFQWKHAFQYLIRALEKEPGPSDEVEAGNDGEADGQLKLDFHIPAAACWIQHNGKRLYDGLVNDELRGLNKRDIPSVARHFDHPLDRWEFWRNRFMKIRKNESDSFVKEAAATAADVMRNIQG